MTSAKVIGDQNAMSFQADISSAVGFSVTSTQNPYRVIIDLPDVSFDLPPGVGRQGAGLVTAFRYGFVEDRKSRVVLDLSGPVLIGKSIIVPAQKKHPAHLLVEMISTSQENFKAAYAQEHPEFQVTAAITPASTPKPPLVKPKLLKTIVIDAGHGGIDPGASSPTGTREKDVVLSFAKTLRDTLQANGNYKVVLTRGDDRIIALEDRVKIARDNKADLFIVIHADTVKQSSVRGTTVYTVSDKASDAEAEELAQKENRSDIIAGIDLGNQNKTVSDILINLAQRESKNQAMYFAKKAVVELKPVAHMTGKPVRSAAFVVLKAPDVPSVLVELGYLSNAEDEALLTSPEWRLKMANAITKAVGSYFPQGPQTASTHN